MQTTHLTDQRHVVIPKTICDAYHLNIGQELEIELTPQGILLKPKVALAKTKLEHINLLWPYKHLVKYEIL